MSLLEYIAKRVDSVDAKIDALDKKIDAKIEGLDNKIDELLRFKWQLYGSSLVLNTIAVVCFHLLVSHWRGLL